MFSALIIISSFLFSMEDKPSFSHEFSLYAPDAIHVSLVIFENVEDSLGIEYPMEKVGDEFIHELPQIENGILYGFKVENGDSTSQQFTSETIITDPFSNALATQNHYAPINKSIIHKAPFDWGNDGQFTWVDVPSRDLIIYEAHLKDMTMHPSSEADQPGTYLGFVEPNQKGGIAHLKKMGYNAVEFLPIFEFGNVEIPYLDSTQNVINTWNPYATNHWGYMPSSYFAPEGNFATNSNIHFNEWNGVDGRQVNEFKTVVKALHEEGIAVILDVVYNHVSQYDFHPLKHLNKTEYFRQNAEGGYSSVSGCGNDLKTENKYIRKMIVESIKFWMTEYHIDGFRFDLGKLIDWETIVQIKVEAEKINPHVFITCEPWGGGYDPNGFSDRGWSSWNDQFRNAFKGWYPDGNGGFLFGKWHHDYDFNKIQRMFMGSPRLHGGQFVDVAHSVNYLESHDDFTLSDFIKIEMGLFNHDSRIEDIDAHARLTSNELSIHKLAAITLLASQGPVMIAQGQEWGRSKVISRSEFPDKNVGKLDHNSYEKDNETNWLNWNHRDMNPELVKFYISLIRIRKENKLLRSANPENFQFIKANGSDVAIGFMITHEGESIAVLMNSHQNDIAEFDMNVANWTPIISTQVGIELKNSKAKLPPISGIILKK
jgi:pullulanase/glycogen debranching enzyme